MDWYLGCAVDDLVVPGNQEMLDMFPSRNDWSQWNLSSSEAFGPTSKYFVTQTGTGNDFNGKRQNKENMELFEHQYDEHSINSNIYQEFEGSVNQDTSPWDISNYQLEDLDMTNRTDDVFLNSSHDISTDASTGPYNFYNTKFENYDYAVLPSDGLYENMIVNSVCDPSHSFGMGSSKYIKTHDFSPYVGGGASLYTPFPKMGDNPPSPVMAQYEEVSVSPEFEIIDEHINVETSPEASVLRELENAITQMSDQTRICFRDALYRLAESSGQSMDLVLEKFAPPIVTEGNFRSRNTKFMESETNAVDRVVANLMFSKMDSDVQFSQCHLSSSDDAEVPVFSLTSEVKQDTA